MTQLNKKSSKNYLLKASYSFITNIINISLLLLAIINIAHAVFTVMVPLDNYSFFKLNVQTSRLLLRSGLPFLERTAGEDDPLLLVNFNWSEVYWRFAGNMKSSSPREILKDQLSLLSVAIAKPPPIVLVPQKIPQPILPQPKKSKIPEKKENISNLKPKAKSPVIFLFHTHTSESYLPVSNKTHKLNKKGDIVLVGRYLQKVFTNKYKIKTIYTENIHDMVPFRDSYKRSYKTMEKYLAQHPEVSVVLDIHRDATPGLKYSSLINSKKTARISIVVGTNKMGLTHPNWQKNHQFAKKIFTNCNHYYPGLCNNILVSDARYNQHLHPRSLIIEFGNQHSDLQEVYAAADLFADSLIKTLTNELKAPKSE